MKWPFGSKKEEKGKKEVDYYPEYPKDVSRRLKLRAELIAEPLSFRSNV